MDTTPELAHAFAAAWPTGGEVGSELAELLVARCAAAHRELPSSTGRSTTAR